MSFYGGIEDTGRLTEDTMARRKLRPRDVPRACSDPIQSRSILGGRRMRESIGIDSVYVVRAFRTVGLAI
jgi:hypothetical protein